MFSSVSAQLNSFQQYALTNDKNNRYFPSSSAVINNFQRHNTDFHHYEPKSKLGQLNQRIEMEKIRRDEIRRKVANLRSSGGYLTESQRSNSSKLTYSNHGSMSQREEHKFHVRHRSPEFKSNFSSTAPILTEQANRRFYKVVQQQPQLNEKPPQVMPPITHQNIYQQMANSSVRPVTSYPVEKRVITNSQPHPIFSQSPSFRRPQHYETQYLQTEPTQMPPANRVFPRIQEQQKIIPPIEITYQPPSVMDASRVSVATAQSHANRSQVNQSYNAYNVGEASLRSPVEYSQKTLSFPQSVGRLIDKSDKTTKIMAMALILIVLCLMIYQIIR